MRPTLNPECDDRILLQDHIKNCMEKATERIDWLLDLEDRPFSLNDHYFADYRSKFLSYYKGARQKDNNTALMRSIQEYSDPSGDTGSWNASMTITTPTGIAKVLSGLVEMGIDGVKPEDLAKLLPPDHMEPALVIMADVRAYFQGQSVLGVARVAVDRPDSFYTYSCI